MTGENSSSGKGEWKPRTNKLEIKPSENLAMSAVAIHVGLVPGSSILFPGSPEM
jgi:hypothetical protein